jgi:hypothetical protein
VDGCELLPTAGVFYTDNGTIEALITPDLWAFGQGVWPRTTTGCTGGQVRPSPHAAGLETGGGSPSIGPDPCGSFARGTRRPGHSRSVAADTFGDAAPTAVIYNRYKTTDPQQAPADSAAGSLTSRGRRGLTRPLSCRKVRTSARNACVHTPSGFSVRKRTDGRTDGPTSIAHGLIAGRAPYR